MSLSTFATPRTFDFEIKDLVKAVKTKKWAKQFANHLGRYAERFTTAGNDHAVTIKSMLISAYGFNIGEQVFNQLSRDHFPKIRSNIMQAVYS